MSRRLRPAWRGTTRTIDDAMWHLREARRLLKIADTPATLKKIASALKSAEGAKRHAYRREDHDDGR